MEASSSTDAIVLRDAVSRAVRFTYGNSVALVGISLAWFVAALPIVTIGPATVGAYRAVIGLRDPEPFDARAVIGTVRRQLVHSVLLGLLPIAFWGVASFYAIQYATADDTVALALFLAAFYVGLYLALQVIPAYVALAHDERGIDAISFGRSWLGEHLTLALMTVVVTAVIAVVLGALTIAFPVFFGGLVSAFHVEVVDDAYSTFAVERAEDDQDDDGFETPESYDAGPV